MAEIYHIFGGIPEHEIDRTLDESGFLTPKGQDFLREIGVETKAKVSIGKSTIQNLFSLYNWWKTPKSEIDREADLIIGKLLSIPEDDVYLQEKLDVLTKSFKMGIKIGEGTRIGENVSLGLGVSIGRYCEISDLCELCIFSTLRDGVFLGKAAFVGKDSDIELGSRVMAYATIAHRNIVRKNLVIPEGVVFNESEKYQ